VHGIASECNLAVRGARGHCYDEWRDQSLEWRRAIQRVVIQIAKFLRHRPLQYNLFDYLSVHDVKSALEPTGE
jgi:hypothetical protein